ncbi:MAG TPA: type Z 30S ribosomal protein S14 [Thermoanaerobaculia bacterium]|nr:type Z 30S ribosomal protein S14 [Thermoanaerobaculia bacterium]
MARRAAIIKANSKLKYAIRKRNRCMRCGRPRAFMRKFGMCRICFRNLALAG